MNPLALASIPAEILGALRVLPKIAERLARISEHTEHLPPLREAIDGVKEDTAALSEVTSHLARVAETTSALPALGDDVRRMDGRMAEIEAAMPVLVEVQQHLADLPETIAELQSGIDRLCNLMEGLHSSMQQLDGDVGSLQRSIEPLGRVAGRIPGGQRRPAG